MSKKKANGGSVQTRVRAALKDRTAIKAEMEALQDRLNEVNGQLLIMADRAPDGRLETPTHRITVVRQERVSMNKDKAKTRMVERGITPKIIKDVFAYACKVTPVEFVKVTEKRTDA
tara:strand:+ start:253 stop:603 length:351 start_codon:yes stop_codon:yes gene_type:complete